MVLRKLPSKKSMNFYEFQYFLVIDVLTSMNVYMNPTRSVPKPAITQSAVFDAAA